MIVRIIAAAVAVVCSGLIAYAQFQSGGAGSGSGSPGGFNGLVQFNTNGVFGGISGLTSDGAAIGFATSSQIILYGLTAGDCLKVGANNQIADFGAGCGGSGSPGGTNSQVQFNTNGSFGGVSGATSNASNISFTTNSLVINGQAIANVSGNTGTLGTISGALVSGNCVKSDANHNLIDAATTCGGTSATNIAAGTNITTSGTTANVTVNVVATPSFTTVIATGNLTAGSAQFAGFLTAGGASISGLSLATGTISGNLTGSTVSLSGNLTAGSAQFTGAVTGTTAVFQTITDALLGGCLNATSGVISSTGVSCATQTSTPSIAAGTNITTSGTAANTTINLVATPSVTTLIASGNLTAATAQFSGFLTAGGASLSGMTIVTETLSGNLTGTSANFSSNLTANIAQFPGFLSAGGGSLSGLTIVTATHTGNLTGTTAAFSGNLTGTTAQFSGQVTGTTAVFQTVTAQNFTTLAQGFVPASSNAAGAFLKGDATFGTPTTIGLASSTTTTPQGWLNWAGLGRTTADTTGFTTTGFGNLITITGLVAGRTYKFDAEIPVKAATAATGGIAIRIGGGATATAVVYDGYIVDFGSTGGVSNGTKGSAQATALSSSVANATLSGTTGHITVIGTITVNAGGSLILQGGGFTTVTAASAVTAARGATFQIEDIP